MIDFIQVQKRFAGEEILKEASFRINPGERVGIVGPNGAGKSTIFRLITGELDADKGDVLIPKDTKLGHLKQQLNAHSIDETLLEYVLRAEPRLEEIALAIDEIEARLKHLESGSEKDKALDQMGNLQHEFEHLGGYELQTRSESALCGLGFQPDEMKRGFKTFSGGWQMRAELARTLVAKPDILLLDEPSNYLDLPAVEWLQRYLKDFAGTLLLISHDRFLLQTLSDVTLETLGGFVTRYNGGYDYYLKERESRYAGAESARRNQDKKREEIERFVERFRAKNTKATQVQSRIKQLEKMEEIDLPHMVKEVTLIRIPPAPHSGSEMVRLENASFHYTPEATILKGVDLSVARGDRTALVGYNGMGKTTLLRLLAGRLEPTGGKRVLGHQVIIGYQSQEFAEVMPPGQTAYRIVRDAALGESSEKEVRTILGSFGFSGDDVEKPCQVLSGGEKIRLAFARIFINPPNLLILDEPTTHLDIQGRQALEQAISNFNGTVLIVSHDVEFIRHTATSVVAMTPPGITRYHGNYDYYREKSAAATSSAPPRLTGTTVKNSAATDPVASPLNKKELRKQKAQQRQEMLQKTRKLQKKVNEAEATIEKLEAEQLELTDQMSANTEGLNFADLNRRLSEIQYEIELNTSEWEKSSMELEQLLETQQS